MTDDLEKLRAHLRATPPAPGAAAREAALSAALQAFDKIQDSAQGSAAPPRPNPERPKRSGGIAGVLDMLKTLSPAGLLAGTTSVAALVVAVIALSPALREGPPEMPGAKVGGTTAASSTPAEAAPAAAEPRLPEAPARPAPSPEAMVAPRAKAADAAAQDGAAFEAESMAEMAPPALARQSASGRMALPANSALASSPGLQGNNEEAGPCA